VKILELKVPPDQIDMENRGILRIFWAIIIGFLFCCFVTVVCCGKRKTEDSEGEDDDDEKLGKYTHAHDTDGECISDSSDILEESELLNPKTEIDHPDHPELPELPEYPDEKNKEKKREEGVKINAKENVKLTKKT